MLRNFLFCLLFSTAVPAFAQSAGKLFRQGRDAEEKGNAPEAINLYTQALALKKDDDEILLQRARLYVRQKEYRKAVDDFTAALAINDKDEKKYLELADVDILLDDYFNALIAINKLLAQDESNIDALERKAWCFIRTKEFNGALAAVETALGKNMYNYRLHYYKALAKDSLHDFPAACTEYARAITILRGIAPNDVKPLPQFKQYYTNYAFALYNNQQYDESVKQYTIASTLDPGDKEPPSNYRIYYLRSFPYLMKSDYTNAIGDLNKSVVMNEKDKEPIFQRGMVYMKTSQYQSAINDLTRFLQLDDASCDAFALRGKCYFELTDYKDAIRDLSRAVETCNRAPDGVLLADAKKKLYEANREADPPEIKTDYPAIDMSGFINVLDNQQTVVIEGHVRDKSLISSVSINGFEAKFNSSEINPEFSGSVPLYPELRKLDLVVTDIYNNVSTKTIKVGRIVSEAKVKVAFAGKILSDDAAHVPVANREIYLVNEKGEIFFKSRTDENGKFHFENLPYDQPYLLTLDVNDSPFAQKNKFTIVDENNNSVLVSTDDGKQHFRFSILPGDYNTMALMTVDDAPLYIDLKGKLIAGDESRTPLSDMTVILMNNHGEVVATKKTDAFGAFLFSTLVPHDNYTIRTDSAESSRIAYNKLLITDDKGKIIRELTRNAGGYFKYELLHSDQVELSRISESDPWFRTFKLSKDKPELVIIENIYYPSGSFEIMPEAESVLAKALDALKKNPRLEMVVESHTDAVAGDDYNMELSQKRASTVVDYLVSKGIDRKRLTAKGYGETQLTNRCGNGVECSDAEHRQNRRTVFRIEYSGNK